MALPAAGPGLSDRLLRRVVREDPRGPLGPRPRCYLALTVDGDREVLCLDEKILGLYAGGMSVRDIYGDLSELEAIEAVVPLAWVQGPRAGLALGHDPGFNDPSRSRGVRTSTGPRSVETVFPVAPLRTLAAARGARGG